MNTQRKTNEKGFTIIEVVLVLAIAGLIFLMVFIALPALQRGQRDTQRRGDLSRVQKAVQEYQSNNRNALPTFNNDFITRYLKVGGDSFQDPNGTDYTFNTGAMPEESEFVAEPRAVYVSTGAVCNGESITTNQGARKVALRMKLEGGGIACVNN